MPKIIKGGIDYTQGSSVVDWDSTSSSTEIKNKPPIRGYLNDSESTSTPFNDYISTIIGSPDNVAKGRYSLAEGEGTWVSTSGQAGHAEGYHTVVHGIAAHAEGYNTYVHINVGGHAEGINTIASGRAAHAEGGTSGIMSVGGFGATGDYSHTEGYNTITYGDYSHAEGYCTIDWPKYQHVQGKYNVIDYSGRYADIVGWGDSELSRKNISSLTTNGDLHLAGKVYIKSRDDGTGGTELMTISSLAGHAGKMPIVNENSDGWDYVEIIGSEGIEVVKAPEFIQLNHTNHVDANTSEGLAAITYDENGHITSSTTKTFSRGISDSSNEIGHSNSITADTTSGLKYFTYDDYGHVASATNKTLGRGLSDQSNVIGHTNSIIESRTPGLKILTYDSEGHITSGINKIIGRGLDDQVNVIGHSNSITPSPDKKLYKIAYDDYGHITDTEEVEVAISPNWNQNTASADDFIAHRPAIISDTNSTALTPDRNTGVRLNDITNNVASGNNALAEGRQTTASGDYSHAEGYLSTASRQGAHAEGIGTKASSDAQHVQGKYNVEDPTGTYADIVGWGTNSTRKNISALDTSGNLKLKGSVYIGASNNSTGGYQIPIPNGLDLDKTYVLQYNNDSLSWELMTVDVSPDNVTIKYNSSHKLETVRKIYDGTAVPSSSLGSVGDIYFRYQ